MAVKKIQLEPEQLNRLAQKLKSTATDIQGHSIELNSAYKNIDWSFAASACVDRRISQAEIMRKQVNEQLIQMSQYVLTSAILLSDADKQTGSVLGATSKPLPWWNSNKAISTNAEISTVVIPVIGGLTWFKQCIMPKDGIERFFLLNKLRADVLALFERNSLIKNFIDKYPIWSIWANLTGEQCKGFAKRFYLDVYGIEIPGTNDTNEYKLDIVLSSEIYEVVPSLVNSDKVGAEDVSRLFANAKPGDLVQMVGKSGLHSAIFAGVDEQGNIWFYDANSDNKEGIKLHSYTPEQYAEYLSCKGGGATLYRPN